MQYWRSLLLASARIVAEGKKLLMMTGRIALSSKLPCEPAKAMALSSESTWMQTMTMASHWVGLTLPGMIDDPGSLAGSTSSLMPQRGPEASQRMSLAIFMRHTARPRRPADALTIASRLPWAAHLFAAVVYGCRVSA